MKNKKAQFHIPFNLIFSIILIIAFIVVAIYGIKMVLDWREQIEIRTFVTDLEDKINNVWAYDKYDDIDSFKLPLNVEYVCFADINKGKNSYEEINEKIKWYYRENRNIFFYPPQEADIKYYYIEYIDIEKTTSEKNPYCVENINGKITIRINKNLGDAKVCIGENC